MSKVKLSPWEDLDPDTWAHLGQMAEFGVLSASMDGTTLLQAARHTTRVSALATTLSA